MKLKKMLYTGWAAALFLAAALSVTLGGCTSSGKGAAKAPAKLATAPEKPGNTLRDRLAGKTWLLSGYDAGSVFVPLEPDHGSTAWILFLPDGTLNGSTGVNTFTGSWKLGDATGSPSSANIAITVGGMTRMAAPNEIAAKFEKDLVRELAGSRRLKTGKDSILLADAQDKILLQFIYRGEPSLF